MNCLEHVKGVYRFVVYNQCCIVLNSDVVACPNWKYQRFLRSNRIQIFKSTILGCKNYTVADLVYFNEFVMLELKQTQFRIKANPGLSF